jgi:hypothetical protein
MIRFDRIFLPGCYPADKPLKQIWTEIIRGGESTDMNGVVSSICETIPMRFTTHKDWPKKTALLCHNCGLSINGIPIYRPHPTINDVNEFYCQAPCMIKHIMDMNLAPSDREQMLDVSLSMCRMFYKRDDISCIEPAPGRTEMVDYVGRIGRFTKKTYCEYVVALAYRANCVFIDTKPSVAEDQMLVMPAPTIEVDSSQQITTD